MSKVDTSKKTSPPEQLTPEEQEFKDLVLNKLAAEHGPQYLVDNKERLDLEWETFLASGLL